MRLFLISLLAMVAGWLVPLIGLASYQLGTVGRLADLGVMAVWTGVFALLGWGAFVLPCLLWWGDRRWFSSPGLAWLGWSLLGMLAYCLLVVPLTAMAMLMVIWYPALVGAMAGFTYAWIERMAAPAPPTGASGKPAQAA